MIRDSIELVSTNSNGVFDQIIDKKKDREIPALENCKLYHYGIGAVISEDITPKFQDWTYADYMKEFNSTKAVRYLEPMSAFEDETYLERDEQLPHEIAELKMDGHRGLVYIGKEYNRAFSRRPSKKTGWFSENSDQIPHIRDLKLPGYDGTVLDGEFDYGNTSMGVQSVMGAKPENAIQFQFKNGFIPFKAFDILYYKGINVQKMPLWKRKIYLYKVTHAFSQKYANCNIEFAKIYMHKEVFAPFFNLAKKYLGETTLLDHLFENVSTTGSYADKFAEKVAEGLEGLIVKDIHAIYEQKRSKSFIKLKAQGTWDCFIIGLTEPTKVYDGKEIITWKYWEIDGKCLQFNGQATAVHWADMSGSQAIPVTKPYFMGWCGAIEFAVHKPMQEREYIELLETGLDEQVIDDGSADYIDGNLYWIIHVGDCKGLSDSTLEDLKQNAEKYIRERRVLEVLANGILDKEKGSLRHPRWVQWRDDKSAEMCDFKSHIREE